MEEKESPAPPIEVPASALSEEALSGLIDSFILREGTDYGWNETTLDTKRAQVRRQLEKADIKIVFDPGTESVTLMTAREWQKHRRAAESSSESLL